MPQVPLCPSKTDHLFDTVGTGIPFFVVLRFHAAAPLICASCVFPREYSEPVLVTDFLLFVCAKMRSDLQVDCSLVSSQLRRADLVPVHKAPVTINVDKHILKLGDTSHTCGPT